MSIHFSSATMHWNTPVGVYRDLHAEFQFDYDPCPPDGTHGLCEDWSGKRGTATLPMDPKFLHGWRSTLRPRLRFTYCQCERTHDGFNECVLPTAREIRFIKGR